MSPNTTTCGLCKQEKTTDNHIEHVRAYMVRVYGSDKCLRKDCPEQAAHRSGYCTEHHTEWIHAESMRCLTLLSTDFKKRPDELTLPRQLL